ncbi:MAG: DUF11 domain-containing protein, partial [Bifidobacteriaceae bacterium]|nr:DUF11 domain-containing protein [Bifidobacteriaceae bacterium]
MKRRVLVAALPAVVIAIGLALGGTPRAEAANTMPFTKVFSTNANGSITTIGNTLQTCPTNAAYCAQARAGSAYDNNNFQMTHLDADSDPSTFNSSAAELALPEGSQVLFAGLYWGARLSGTGGGSSGNGALANRMSLAVPGGSYQTVIGQELARNPAQSNAYQSFYDATDEVRQAGNGIYWGANVQAGTGADRYAGWALTVVYSAPGMPLRNLSVFNGFNTVGSNYPQTITVDGFTTPVTGPVDALLSMVAYEGDLGITGDYTRLNNMQLASNVSPGVNFFNSVISDGGSYAPGRTPSYVNQLGFDIKNLNASGAISNNVHSATFRFESTGDVYYPGVLALAINLYAPDFSTSTKTVASSSTSTDTTPGDTLTYTLMFANTGQDHADRSTICDPLPTGVDYIPGSLKLLTAPDVTLPVPQPITDDGTGLGYYNDTTRTICVNVGAGAGAYLAGQSTNGGRLETGKSTSLEFQVKLNESAGGTTVKNSAGIEYQTATTHTPGLYNTPPVSTTVNFRADMQITKAMSPMQAISGQAGTTTLTATNRGPDKATGVVVTDPLPGDYTASAIDVQITASGGAPRPGPACPLPTGTDPVTCQIGELAVGERAVVTISGRPNAGSQA